ncbi:MAG: RHS repeat-associated core domain-containing protein, partial [Vicinamibacterales bacterium]
TVTYDQADVIGVQTPLGNSYTQFVDAAGRVIRSIDARGRVTKFEYDALNQATKITDPLGGETTFTYDGNGNVLTLTDARGKTTTWTYNNMDQVATRTDPLTRQESFTYDLNGNRKTWTDRKSKVTTYSYDALDRRTFAGFDTTGNPPTYASTITTTYDAGNRATQMVDSGAGTITHTYDLLDRLTQEQTPEGTITYTYDAASRRATAQVTGQTSVSYTYDNTDRLTAVTQGTATVSIAYDNANRRTSLTLPNGIVTEYSYDHDSQLTGLTYKLSGSTIGTLVYTYDAAGQRAAVEGTYARSNLPAALTSATHDDANQIATWGGTSFSYDSNGNLTSDGTRTYTWNARNELTAISGPVSASFAYDGFGRRRAKTVSGMTTQFLYDGLNPVQELASGTPTANTLTGLGIDEYFRRIDSSTTRYYLADALQSSIALTDGSGAVQTSYTYESFGGLSTSGSGTPNTIGYTGREADGTGLFYYRARYYDPRLQRFLTEDPVGLAAGINVFAYVVNSPTRYIDPLGLKPVAGFGPSGGGGGGAGQGTGGGNQPPADPPFGECFAANREFSLNAANMSWFDVLRAFGWDVPSWTDYIPFLPKNGDKTAAFTFGSAKTVANATGLTTLKMAAPDLMRFQGVANLGVRGTVISVGANTVLSGILSGAAYQVGANLGSLPYALGQALAGNCQ